MKLNFAENIRKLRRENGLTQEQLAEKVGVSFQTVSRWETGVVYPDIELLPALAELFETRVDELIGCTKNDKDKILEKRWEEYEKLTVAEEEYAYLKEMKRDFPKEYYIPYLMMKIMYNEKIHTDELCAVFEDFSALCTDKFYIDEAQDMYISLEEESAAIRFIQASGISESDASKYLQNRYRYRKERKKQDLYRQLNLIESIKNICHNQIRKCNPISAENSLWGNIKSLELINLICGKAGEDLITGGKDNLDLWWTERVYFGFGVGAARAATGNKEGAYEAIEASIGIIEKIAALPEGAELTFGSPIIDRITGKLKISTVVNGYTCHGFLFYDGEERLDGKLVTDCLEMKVHILSERKGWEWFDSIREEERYKALAERLKKAVN